MNSPYNKKQSPNPKSILFKKVASKKSLKKLIKNESENIFDFYSFDISNINNLITFKTEIDHNIFQGFQQFISGLILLHLKRATKVKNQTVFEKIQKSLKKIFLEFNENFSYSLIERNLFKNLEEFCMTNYFLTRKYEQTVANFIRKLISSKYRLAMEEESNKNVQMDIQQILLEVSKSQGFEKMLNFVFVQILEEFEVEMSVCYSDESVSQKRRKKQLLYDSYRMTGKQLDFALVIMNLPNGVSLCFGNRVDEFEKYGKRSKWEMKGREDGQWGQRRGSKWDRRKEELGKVKENKWKERSSRGEIRDVGGYGDYGRKGEVSSYDQRGSAGVKTERYKNDYHQTENYNRLSARSNLDNTFQSEMGSCNLMYNNKDDFLTSIPIAQSEATYGSPVETTPKKRSQMDESMAEFSNDENSINQPKYSRIRESGVARNKDATNKWELKRIASNEDNKPKEPESYLSKRLNQKHKGISENPLNFYKTIENPDLGDIYKKEESLNYPKYATVGKLNNNQFLIEPFSPKKPEIQYKAKTEAKYRTNLTDLIQKDDKSMKSSTSSFNFSNASSSLRSPNPAQKDNKIVTKLEYFDQTQFPGYSPLMGPSKSKQPSGSIMSPKGVTNPQYNDPAPLDLSKASFPL
jgi:hypothetical protein